MNKVYPQGNTVQSRILKLKYDTAIELCKLRPEVKVSEVINKR